MAFNNGKPYHGSDKVKHGKLIGRSGKTDYFFFLCPSCANGQVLRVLDYESREGTKFDGGEERKVQQHLNFSLHLWCPVCKFEDFIKIDNSHRSGRLPEDELLSPMEASA